MHLDFLFTSINFFLTGTLSGYCRKIDSESLFLAAKFCQERGKISKTKRKRQKQHQIEDRKNGNKQQFLIDDEAFAVSPFAQEI